MLNKLNEETEVNETDCIMEWPDPIQKMQQRVKARRLAPI